MVELKVAQFPHKVAKNVEQTVFTLKVVLFKNPNSFPDIWATFVMKLVAKNFKKIAQSGRAAGKHDLIIHLTLELISEPNCNWIFVFECTSNGPARIMNFVEL